VSGRWPAAAVLVLAAFPAEAYVRSTTSSGLCLWWSTRAVHYEVNDFAVNGAASVCSSSLDPPGSALAAVEASFTTWSGAGGCTDMQTVYDGSTPSTATGLDCANLVVFRRGPCDGLVPPGDPCLLWNVNGSSTFNCADKYNCWDTGDPFHGDSRVIALTTVSYDNGSGEIVDADIELNAWTGAGSSPPGYYFTCVDPPAPTCGAPGDTGCISMDVQNTVTHEAGHVLGLGHSLSQYCPPNVTVANEATMCATASLGETAKRTLAPDDVAGICAIYPAGAPTRASCDGSRLLVPRQSSSCQQPSSCGCGTAGAEGWLGLAALLLWRRRRG
jgi:hypothetical protein